MSYGRTKIEKADIAVTRQFSDKPSRELEKFSFIHSFIHIFAQRKAKKSSGAAEDSKASFYMKFALTAAKKA